MFCRSKTSSRGRRRRCRCRRRRPQRKTPFLLRECRLVVVVVVVVVVHSTQPARRIQHHQHHHHRASENGVFELEKKSEERNSSQKKSAFLNNNNNTQEKTEREKERESVEEEEEDEKGEGNPSRSFDMSGLVHPSRERAARVVVVDDDDDDEIERKMRERRRASGKRGRRDDHLRRRLGRRRATPREGDGHRRRRGQENEETKSTKYGVVVGNDKFFWDGRIIVRESELQSAFLHTVLVSVPSIVFTAAVAPTLSREYSWAWQAVSVVWPIYVVGCLVWPNGNDGSGYSRGYRDLLRETGTTRLENAWRRASRTDEETRDGEMERYDEFSNHRERITVR